MIEPVRKPVVAISLGDPAGIGPEIAIKAAIDPRVTAICRPLLVGDRSTALAHARLMEFDVEFVALSQNLPKPSGHQVAFLHLDLIAEADLDIGRMSAAHGRAAVGAAEAAIAEALCGRADAVVACPQTELSIKQAGIDFDGYPSLVARCTDTSPDDALLMLCFDDRRIVHTTLHVSLRRAIELITLERVQRAIQVTHSALVDLGVLAPRMAVSGLNPHAGEHGMFGSEDDAIIAVAIARANADGCCADGPIGADILFDRPGYDAFVVMYHDQGHIAAKLLAPRRTAGMTIGTPILFSSVAHGSALDIAGRNIASPDAVVEAVMRMAGAAIQRAIGSA